MPDYRFVLRHLLNYWPPLLGAGICITAVSADARAIDVVLKHHWWTRNSHGTQFGGSLFAMTDPFYPLMLAHNLGPDYIIWDQAAAIEYITPGRGPVTAAFRLSQERIDEIGAATADGQKYLPAFEVEILGAGGVVVARVKRVIYVRKKAK